jgi:hypothetical protein
MGMASTRKHSVRHFASVPRATVITTIIVAVKTPLLSLSLSTM